MQVATREQGGKVALSLCSSLGVVSELWAALVRTTYTS